LLGKTLQGGELAERIRRCGLIIVPSGLARKNRKAEATANGEAGTTNQYGRYLGRRKTLNET